MTASKGSGPGTGAGLPRRDFVRLAGGGAVFAALPPLAGCAGDMPEAAVAAWRGPPADVEVREWILGHAILAPHSHNLQSWLVDLGEPDTVTLYCDTDRLLPETDPFSRQIMMSHGTFLELFDMAARQRRLRAETTLFPEGAFAPAEIDARPVARVRLTAEPGMAPDPLFARVFERHTNREPYRTDPVPAAAVEAIGAATAGFPVRSGFALGDDPAMLARQRRIAAEAWRIELTTPRTILESYRVLRVGPREIAEHRDGIALTALVPRLLVGLGLFDRSRAPAPDDYAVTSQVEEFAATLEATPAFFWLVSEGNDRATQVEAGRAWVRAQLAATAHGLAMQPISQALQEYPEVAGPYADIHQLLAAPPPRYTVQMWARLGYGPEIGPAPRRGVGAHIRR